MPDKNITVDLFEIFYNLRSCKQSYGRYLIFKSVYISNEKSHVSLGHAFRAKIIVACCGAVN